MASEKPIPQRGPYYMSPEECQEMFRDFGSGPWAPDVPEHHKRILEERIARYCKNGVVWTPWEEFEKELVQELMKDYRENGLHGIVLDEFEKELLEELMKG